MQIVQHIYLVLLPRGRASKRNAWALGRPYTCTCIHFLSQRTHRCMHSWGCRLNEMQLWAGCGICRLCLGAVSLLCVGLCHCPDYPSPHYCDKKPPVSIAPPHCHNGAEWNVVCYGVSVGCMLRGIACW